MKDAQVNNNRSLLREQSAENELIALERITSQKERKARGFFWGQSFI